jgi:hypothetical protein
MLRPSNGNVRYRVVITNTGSVDLTSIYVSSSGADRTYSSLRRRATQTWELPATPWSAGGVRRSARVTAKHRSTTVSGSDDAHYFGLAPSLRIQLQVLDDNGVWRVSREPVKSGLFRHCGWMALTLG